MPREAGETADDKHIQFGEVDTFTNPPGFNPGGDAETCSQWFGRTMENPGHSGFGSASIEPDNDD